MKTSSIFLLAGALTLAAGTALVARALMRPPPPVATVLRVEAAPPPVPDVMVLSASQPLLPGDFIDPSMLAWRKAQGQPASDQITATSNAERLSRERELLGAAVRVPLETDTPFTRGKLVRTGEAGFIAAVLTPGMRAMSIPTSALSSNSGLVQAGDRVDVILNLRHKSVPVQFETMNPFKPLAAQTILRNVRVLALNNITSSIGPGETGAPLPETPADKANRPAVAPRTYYETLTLEVPPAAAERLAVAKEIGTLQVALRGTRELLEGDHDATIASVSPAVTRLNDTTAIFTGGKEKAAVQVYQGRTHTTLQFE